jgi:hypothetical protein
MTAACADDQPATRVTMPSRPSAAFAAAGCDFTLMKKNARAYFVSTRDPVYDLIQQLSSLNTKGTAATFKQKGFEILAYVGSVAGTSAVTTPTAGDAFVRDDLTCLGFPTTAGTFTGALGANGLFAVRGGANDPATAVLSRGGLPTYGAETKGSATWAESAGQQFLFYGFPRNWDFTEEDPALGDNQAYQLETIPDVTFSPPIRGFVCTGNDPIAANTLLQHEGEILARETPAACALLSARSNGDEGSGVFALARRVTDWLAPRPLYASSMFFVGIGASLGGLSPIGPVNVDVSGVVLTIVSQPTTGSINQALTPPVVVKAVTANGTTVDGLTVNLLVTGNNGSFTISGAQAVTTGGGIATFNNFQTTKAGGYTFVAVGSLDGFNTQSPPSAVSLMINVNGQQ